jgi:hypothetical protein
MKWTKELDDKLIELYPKTQSIELVGVFNRSIKSIGSRAHRLGLFKTKELRGKLIGRRNKMVGRDLTYEKLKEIASGFKTRGEFQLGDSSAYTSARIMGVLDDICSHMAIISFSIPQLILKDILDGLLNLNCNYNDRTVIKPYEIDIYYPNLKLGFEYNGRLWHKEKYNNDRDVKKSHICIEKGIILIYIIENNRRYEEDVKNQLVEQLEKINYFANSSIKIEDVMNYKIGNIYEKLYNKDELLLIAHNYNSFKVFIKKEPKIYAKLSRMKLLDEATKHMSDRRKKRNLEEIVQVITKYKNLSDLYKNDFGTYFYIKKNKLNHLISHLKSRFNK